MTADESSTLSDCIEADDVNNERVRSILRGYFAVNSDEIWRDALVEHDLLLT